MYLYLCTYLRTYLFFDTDKYVSLFSFSLVEFTVSVRSTHSLGVSFDRLRNSAFQSPCLARQVVMSIVSVFSKSAASSRDLLSKPSPQQNVLILVYREKETALVI